MPDCHFLAPPERENLAGRIIELLALTFFALMNLLILFLFLTTRLGGWPVPGYALAAGYFAALTAGCVLITRLRFRPGHILLALMLLSLVVRLLYVSLIPTPANSDFLIQYEAAQSAAAGDFSWTHAADGYFCRWGYQIPFALYESLVLRLAPSILALKLLNVLFMVGSNYLLYRVGRLFLSETAALSIAFLYAVFPGAVMYASILTNQHISLFFLLLGIFLLLRWDRWQTLLLAGFFLAVSDLMRPGTIVALAALLACGLLRCIQSPRAARFRRFAVSAALVLGCYWLTKKLTECALVWTDIAPYGLGSHAPEWMFILGLGNVEGFGCYSEELSKILHIEDAAARHAAAAEAIGGLFRRPLGEILHFFIGKVHLFWTAPQSIEWSLWGMGEDAPILLGITMSQFREGVRACERAALLLVYLLALPAPVLLWRQRKAGGKAGGAALFCAAMVCVIFCAYLLIEIQPRYRYFAIPFWLLCGGLTSDALARRDSPEGGHIRL